MKNVKNILRTAIFPNLMFGLSAILTVVFANDASGQDFSRIFAPEGATVTNQVLTANITPGCTEYNLILNTGDLEGADADASVFVTLHGTAGDTDRIEISGGLTVRDDKIHTWDGSTCLEAITAGDIESRKYKAVTFVRWGSNKLVINSVLNSIKNPFTRNKTAVVVINTHDVGNVESITLEHDNWYPAWYLKSLELYKGDDHEFIFGRDVNRWFREDSLKQTFKVNPDRNLTDYRIKVFTGDVYQAGTNSKVQLTLNDRKRSIPSFDLGKIIPGNPFERNQTDETGIYDQPQIDGLPSITVTLEKGARWFLGSIKVESPNLFPPGVFRYNNWIEGGSPVTIYPVEERRSPTRKVTFRNEAGYDARMMIQYSENGKQQSPATPNMPPGQNSVIEIPQDAKDPKIFLLGSTTLKDNVYTSDFAGYLAGDPCFKAWGTLFSPQGGTCDGKPVSTTTLNPIPPSVYPSTVAEGEQGCYDHIQRQISEDTSQTLKNVFSESIIKRLCKGTKDPLFPTACYSLRVTDIGSDNAIAECTGQVPVGSTPKIGATTNTSNTSTNITQNEQDCFDRVQNKVAYDTAGHKAWNENNIRNLCRGTTNPASTIACFSSKMPQSGWVVASRECSGAPPTQVANLMPIPTASPSSNLDGDWEMYNDKGVKFDKFAKITQSGSNLSINNGYGTKSTAVLNGNVLKTSDGLSGTVTADGKRIDWDIKFVWVKQASTPSSSNSVAAQPLGTARDIDVKNGVVWIVGTTPVLGGGYIIFKFNGSGWTPFDGGAVRIAVDNTGNPWMIDSEGKIFSLINNKWTEIPGMPHTKAADIAITRNGDVWVVTTTGLVTRRTASGWTAGRGLNAKQIIALANSDTLQIVEPSGKRWTRESEDSWIIANDPSGLADKYLEFAVDLDGTKWVIDSSFNIWKLGGE